MSLWMTEQLAREELVEQTTIDVTAILALSPNVLVDSATNTASTLVTHVVSSVD